MQVGICYTKKAATPLLEAFAHGVVSSGDSIVSIYNVSQAKLLNRCDVTVQASAYNRHMMGTDNALRKLVQEAQKPAIIMDTGAISLKNTQIGYGNIKGLAEFCNHECPPDRWESHGLEIRPWVTEGAEVLILGQSKNGISTQLLDIFEVYDQIISSIPESFTIAYRHHPKCDIDYAHPRISRYSRGSLSDDLKNAWCSVSYSTNAVVEAIINGVPSIVLSKTSIAADKCYQEKLDLTNVPTFDRLQWLSDLAYAEWSSEDILHGLPWRRLREHAQNHSGRQ